MTNTTHPEAILPKAGGRLCRQAGGAGEALRTSITTELVAGSGAVVDVVVEQSLTWWSRRLSTSPGLPGWSFRDAPMWQYQNYSNSEMQDHNGQHHGNDDHHADSGEGHQPASILHSSGATVTAARSAHSGRSSTHQSWPMHPSCGQEGADPGRESPPAWAPRGNMRSHDRDHPTRRGSAGPGHELEWPGGDAFTLRPRDERMA